MYQTLSDQGSASGRPTWQSRSINRKTVEISHSTHSQRLQLIRQDAGFSAHDFYLLLSAFLDSAQFNESELSDMVKAYVDTHCTEDQAQSSNERNGGISDWDWISQLFGRLPDAALWQLIRGAIAARAQLSDEVIMNLDDAMQGQLFFENHVRNRRARIAFACSGKHIIYMREAAGAKNVWMSDEEFAQLVELDDSFTFACFARCEQMRPHHLLFIQHKLAADPHRSDFLASSDDAKITLMKALEVQGNSPELAWMRQVLESTLAGVDPRSLWRIYLDTRQQAESAGPKAFRGAANDLPMSTAGPFRASAAGQHPIK